MLPTKYHAFIFIGALVMLLLLGLHLLGVGLTGGGGGGVGANQAAAARTAALARNSSSQTSSSSSPSAYRHPIVYDKLTGATNNQINEVLGSTANKQQQPSTADFPIDHYNQRQQLDPFQQQQQQQQLPQDDFFGLHRPAGFPPMHMSMGAPPPPPPVPQIPPPPTSQRPNSGRQPLQMGRQPLAVAPPADSVGTATSGSGAGVTDSLPSASSLNNNGAQRPLSNSSVLNQQLPANHLSLLSPQSQQQQQQQQQQSPYYYTPPIFAYNNFDQNRALTEPQYNTANQHYGFPAQSAQPPLGVPEPPMSVDEYNARQARLRQLQLLQPNNDANTAAQIDRYGGGAKQQVAPQQLNLLAEPREQNRHKQQMLDRQLLFANNNNLPNNYNSVDQQQQLPLIVGNNQSQYYPDATAYRLPFATGARGPPYAHTAADLEQQQLVALSKPQSAQNRILTNNQQPPPSSLRSSPPPPPPPQPERQLIKSQNPAPLILQQQQPVERVPLCARQVPLAQQVPLEAANSSGQLPALFCNEDSEYPTKEIMRALELYATERSIEQLLPQVLVQLQLAATAAPAQRSQQQPVQLVDLQRQLSLDALQPSIGALRTNQPFETQNSLGDNQVAFDEQRSSAAQTMAPLTNLFPSANYDSMCRSTVYMAQPKRAKNLQGQWKVVVNLPGHKYRGIAVSQMVRIEECSRPNGECAFPSTNNNNNNRSGNSNLSGQQQPATVGRTRCLQHYENQRLVAWSHQQGLHLDIFRVPIACSCHIRR